MGGWVDASGGVLARFHLDLPLILGLIALSGVGLVLLYSAGGQDADLVVRHALRLGVAFTAMIVVAQIHPRHFYHWSPWLYGGGCLLLGAVLAFGEAGKGAQRWLDLGPVNFQPSELMKVVVPMMLAQYLSERALPPRLGPVIVCLLLIAVPTALIARQPDLGTALLVACSGGFVVFLAGVRWRLLGSLALLVAASAPLLWAFMHDYQRRRVLTFLNPEQDPLGAGYHIIQSKIAVGSGGLYGKGWLNGSQAQLDFVPERATDFVFAVFGEEFGLLGVVVLLAIYFLVIARGLYLALGAQELYGRLLAGGLVLTFFVYVFVNVGMVTGLMPVVGLPLPLLSYGGTALVTVMVSFGVVMSVHTHRRLLSS